MSFLGILQESAYSAREVLVELVGEPLPKLVLVTVGNRQPGYITVQMEGRRKEVKRANCSQVGGRLQLVYRAQDGRNITVKNTGPAVAVGPGSRATSGVLTGDEREPEVIAEGHADENVPVLSVCEVTVPVLTITIVVTPGTSYRVQRSA